MTDEETIQKLMNLRLRTMAQAFRDLLSQAPGTQMSFSELVALMVDREWTDRENRRLARLMRAARLSVSDASLENVWCDPARGIDKAVIRDLATGKWIKNHAGVPAAAGRRRRRRCGADGGGLSY
jgi:DNA replication protein DnaC